MPKVEALRLGDPADEETDVGPVIDDDARDRILAWIAEANGELLTGSPYTLPGVSDGRAPQLLAGALVAEATMDLFGVEELEICPWALREGVILRRLDHLPG